MVSGRQWPGGDPFLQRQNEPSLAVSTRNPQHLLAGANDYRTVDLPGILGSEESGDAWLGLFKSFDGGNTWTSTLLPGYPQDTSREGLLSPLKGYQAGSDPTVRASTNGLFYYSGIVFNRGEEGRNVLFVARFVDNNNKEAGDSIQYIDTNVVNKRKKKHFVDKPWLAVDIPRANSRSCSIRVPKGDGTFSVQSFPGGNVYISYTDAEGEDADSTRLMFARSTNCGANWDKADSLSDPHTVNQGSIIAVDPNSGTVYVAWRQIFLSNVSKSAPDAIMIAKSTNGGISFSKPVAVASIAPFDLGTFPNSSTGPGSTYRRFRTETFPTMAIDANSDPSRPGRVYLAWSESGRGPGGDERVVASVAQDGGSLWAPARVVDSATAQAGGHQIMASMTFSAGKLMLLFYDFRGDFRPVPAEFVADPVNPSPPVWHTVDVRVAQADPANTPVFVSAPVSKYLYLLGRSGKPWQVQASSVNYPMFAQGTLPFMGDYIDITAPAMIQDAGGRWKFNTEPLRSPVFQSVWTDNRDVIPPPKPQNWTKYSPPGALGGTQSKFDPTKTVDACVPGVAGMRNQNIYTARITQGLVVGSPGNAKPLGKIQRAFVVYVENATDTPRSYRLTIAAQPPGGRASFLQFELRTSLNVTIARRSSVARTVFVTSNDSRASTSVNVVEINAVGGAPIPGGLQGSVVLNPDILNPDILNPDILNPDILNPDILNLEVSAPNIADAVLRPDILNPDILNPDILNPDILNPDILNPDILNPDILNPDILNPDILNPDILNPDILNPDILNTDPDVLNADKSKLQINDIFWTIKNNGNTTSAYSFNLKFRSRPKGFKFQLLIYRVSSTPAVKGCAPVNQQHEQLVANIVNPDILNPDILNPDILNGDVRNVSLFIAPGDTAKVQLRVFDLDKFDANVIQIKPRTSSPARSTLANPAFDLDLGLFGDLEIGGEPITAALVSQAVDTAAAQAGITQPSAATTSLTVTTTVLPAGRVASPFSYQLLASGGTRPLTWNLAGSSTLPPNLALSPTGLIGGTPATAGTFVFTVQVVDSSAPQQVATRELTLSIAPPLGSPALVFVSEPAPCSDTLNPAPSCVRENVPISPPVSVRAFSAAGTPVVGVSVGVGFGLNRGGGTLSGTTTASTDSNGVAGFDSLTLSKLGAYTLVASAARYPLVSTATFNVVSPCDINNDGTVNVLDFQLITNQVLGLLPATSDINRDGSVTAADATLVVNAILGLGCNP